MKFFILLSLIMLVNSEKFKYDNYSLYNIHPKTEKELNVLRGLYENDELDFWSDPVAINSTVGVLTTPGYRKELDNILKINNIAAEVTIENIQSVIDQEQVYDFNPRSGRNMQWNGYYTLKGIYDWLELLAAMNPGKVSVIKGGVSYESRDIKGVKISYGPNRRAIFIEGGIHAREWISPATVNYITHELIYSINPEIIAIAEEFDWYIFPVTNPDGYVWSHEEFRLWRKNRRPFNTEYGVDLNRNWDSNWLVIGASNNPASNTYAGPHPFSELEAETLSQYITSLASQMELYLSFHSSGQLLLIPYGNTTDPLDNYDDAVAIGRYAMDALSLRYGTAYVTGNIAEAIYFATGTSIDWVKEKLRVPLVYCYELRDRGQFGHLLPANQILPNSLEVMDSLVAMIKKAKEYNYMGNSSSSIALSVFVTVFAVFISIFG